MESLIRERDLPRLNLLVLPACCETMEESPDLVEKRKACLTWMREQGMTYLGDPIDKGDTQPQWRPSARLISFRRHREERESRTEHRVESKSGHRAGRTHSSRSPAATGE